MMYFYSHILFPNTRRTLRGFIALGCQIQNMSLSKKKKTIQTCMSELVFHHLKVDS